jgi:hypothetical protein
MIDNERLKILFIFLVHSSFIRSMVNKKLINLQVTSGRRWIWYKVDKIWLELVIIYSARAVTNNQRNQQHNGESMYYVVNHIQMQS